MSDDLFNWKSPAPKPVYPNAPGFKEHTTSKEAAQKIARTVQRDETLIIAELQKAGFHGLTPDECAELLGKTPFSIRPRFTQMKQRGLIFPMGGPLGKRRNASRMRATVHVLPEFQR